MAVNFEAARRSKRPLADRIFINRSVDMTKVAYVGFDMDFTLANYEANTYHALIYEQIVNRLVSQHSYPRDLQRVKYDEALAAFSTRGLVVDTLFGNILKLDSCRNVLLAYHGTKKLTDGEIEKLYLNRFMKHSKNRIDLFTSYDAPVTATVASVVKYMDSVAVKREDTGIQISTRSLPYELLCKDIQASVSYVHTQAIMTYLAGSEWKSLFDYIIVDANKPSWFSGDAPFRRVDQKTGKPFIGEQKEQLKSGDVYSGGSCKIFTQSINGRGNEVLYCGDHIYGDILRSKKSCGWRTFLIVPELLKEIEIRSNKSDLYTKLKEMKKDLSLSFSDCDIKFVGKPADGRVQECMNKISALEAEIEDQFGLFGSLLGSGPHRSFFASKMERYADLYGSSFYNLAAYAWSSVFLAERVLLPHEQHLDAEEGVAGGKTGPAQR